MILKEDAIILVTFVIHYATGQISRREFDLNYPGYMINYFPAFEVEYPRIAQKFANTIERAYSRCSWMSDDEFREATSDALDAFLANQPQAELY